MRRITILLPNELHRRAEREAKVLGISLSELVRRCLALDGEPATSERPRFFARQPWTGTGPTDIAANHDTYLYGL